MYPLLRLAGGLCLPLWLSTASLSAGPFDLAKPLSAEEFAKKVEESKREALRRYPDLANPDTLFARAAKLTEDGWRREDPLDFEEKWNYPLSIAEEVAKKLRVFSPLDPVFSEVVPVFTTKNGFHYAKVRVTRLHRHGISIVHKGGSEFIRREDLTSEQGSKYHSNWRTEVIEPKNLIWNVDSAMHERDREFELSAKLKKYTHEKALAEAKFDFERQSCIEGYERGQASGIRRHAYNFSMRLFELACLAQEFRQADALERIEKELREPVPEPQKTQLRQLDEKIAADKVRYEKIRTLLRGKHCELRRDGQAMLEGIPNRWNLGRGRIELLSPEIVRLRIYNGNNTSNHWAFRLNLESGEATLMPEASKDDGGGTVSFHIAK